MNPAARITGCFHATNVASRLVLFVEGAVVLRMMTAGAVTMIAFNAQDDEGLADQLNTFCI